MIITMESLLAREIITRNELLDCFESKELAARLAGDPSWEHDEITDNWIKRPLGFLTKKVRAFSELHALSATAPLLLAKRLSCVSLPPQLDGPRTVEVAQGMPYLEVVAKGATPQEAISSWIAALDEVPARHEATVLFWRARPEIDGRISFETGDLVWRVYSRLAFSTQEMPA